MKLKMQKQYKALKAIATLIFVVIAGIIISSCKKPYNPPAVKNPNSYLVVEGIINSGGDSTIIKISRTININQTGVDSVSDATVTVEDNQNGSVSLVQKSKGIYFSPKLAIDKSRQYRLRIKTGGEEYLSDFAPVQTTPPIDSVGFTIPNNGMPGMQVYINTH